MPASIELKEDTELTLDYKDILSIFAYTKMIKSCGIAQISGFAVEIEDRLERKLENPSE